VQTAENGLETLLALETGPFDVVLMDIQMPEMDGLQATAAIREMEKVTGAHLPIIALTAHAMNGDREICLAAGMDAFVTKPIKSKELFALLQEVALSRPLPEDLG
jgi:CheY-like chemotaxis protein